MVPLFPLEVSESLHLVANFSLDVVGKGKSSRDLMFERGYLHV